ncbi:MAG TPA: hypothetical protein VHT73_04060 [Thermodesulfobacteriota bacterium]|nr:hypothetical protein [Thermodesulfobacteriota bacterium]
MTYNRFGMILIVIALTLITLPVPAFTEERKPTNQDPLLPLRGIQGVYVVVEGINIPGEPELTQTQVKTDVEMRLRSKGIRVLTRKEALGTLGNPFLYVKVQTMEAFGASLYLYSVEVELRQWASLLQNSDVLTYVPTWSTEVMGMTGSANVERVVQDAVMGSIDRFAEAYLNANSMGKL